MPKYFSEMDSPDDLIQKYATPPASSSPIACQTYHDKSAPHQGTSAAVDFLPSSPPQQAPQQQRTSSTSSHYLCRPQLFGREEASSLSATVPSSRGLERIAERQRKDLPSPESASSQQIYKQREHAIRAPEFPRRRRDPSLVLPFISEPKSSITQGDCYDTEVSEAVLMGDGYGPGPTVTPKPYFRLRQLRKNNPISQTIAGLEPTESGYNRRPAEQSLRQVERKSERNTQAASSCKLNRTSRLLSMQKPTVSRSASFKTQFSDDNISELSYIDPHLASLSMQAGQNMLQGLMITHQGQHQESHEHDQFSDRSHGIDSVFIHRNPTTDRRDTASHQPLRTRRPHGPATPEISPGDTSLLDLEDDMHEDEFSDALTKGKITAKDMPHAFTEDSALHRPLSRGYGQPNMAVTSPPYMKLSDDKATHDQALTLIRRERSFSTIETVISQEPKDMHQQLTVSDIKEIMCQEPITPLNAHGLSFAAANAIVYFCTAFAALRFIFANIDRKLQGIDLAIEMVMAAFAGVIVCLLVHIVKK